MKTAVNSLDCSFGHGSSQAMANEVYVNIIPWIGSAEEYFQCDYEESYLRPGALGLKDVIDVSSTDAVSSLTQNCLAPPPNTHRVQSCRRSKKTSQLLAPIVDWSEF